MHIHGNNMGGTTPFRFPNAPELTFLNKRFFSSPPSLSSLKYPVPGLDNPNHPRLPLAFAFEFHWRHRSDYIRNHQIFE